MVDSQCLSYNASQYNFLHGEDVYSNILLGKKHFLKAKGCAQPQIQAAFSQFDNGISFGVKRLYLEVMLFLLQGR